MNKIWKKKTCDLIKYTRNNKHEKLSEREVPAITKAEKDSDVVNMNVNNYKRKLGNNWKSPTILKNFRKTQQQQTWKKLKIQQRDPKTKISTWKSHWGPEEK